MTCSTSVVAIFTRKIHGVFLLVTFFRIGLTPAALWKYGRFSRTAAVRLPESEPWSSAPKEVCWCTRRLPPEVRIQPQGWEELVRSPARFRLIRKRRGYELHTQRPLVQWVSIRWRYWSGMIDSLPRFSQTYVLFCKTWAFSSGIYWLFTDWASFSVFYCYMSSDSYKCTRSR